MPSFQNRVLNPKLVAFGEVGLSGEVRGVSMAKQRVAEAEKLGFEVCFLPAHSDIPGTSLSRTLFRTA